jgi:hypothetical protein
MKYLLFALAFISQAIFAQAIYDANGQYKGYTQTAPSGVTTTYTPSGQSVGSSQIDNGQTNYYSPNGAYVGTNTATPAPAVPNTTIITDPKIAAAEKAEADKRAAAEKSAADQRAAAQRQQTQQATLGATARRGPRRSPSPAAAPSFSYIHRGKVTDTDPMPFGKHRGVPLQDVPA